MTTKQTKYYWRAWAAAHRADPAADRHELTARALGKHVSSKDLTNAQFDRVLAAFAAVAQPDSVDAQMRQAGMPRNRALHTIREAPAAYVQALCADRFGTRDFETLSDKDLATLAMTLNNRKFQPVGRVPSPGVPSVSSPSPAQAGEGRGEGAVCSLPESDSTPDSIVSDAELADAEVALQSNAEIPSEISAHSRPLAVENPTPEIPAENCPY